MKTSGALFAMLTAIALSHTVVAAQQPSVKLDVNDSAQHPDDDESVERVELESHQEDQDLTAQTGPGHRRGAAIRRGQGQGRGPGPEMRADQEVFHFLLAHHAKIRRSVKKLDNGVETLTESDDPEVAAKIQEHVASMHQRIKQGRGLRFWDDLFVAIFQNHTSIHMDVEKTAAGVKVIETSDQPFVAALIQAHADTVSQFVKHGFDEARKNHSIPPAARNADRDR